MIIEKKEINKFVDLTLLNPQISVKEFYSFIEKAKEYNPYSVCVSPFFAGLAKKLLKNTDIKICSVVGFPTGSSSIKTKVCEIQELHFVNEIDYVINQSAVKSEQWDFIKTEMESLTKAANQNRIEKVKVILETCYLSVEEIVKICEIANETIIDFVKTSTGFGEFGAKISDVKLMKSVFRGEVKASGGIRDYKTAKDFILSGASRIGTSSLLVDGEKNNSVDTY